MSFTLAQYRTQILQSMDALDEDGTVSGRWDSTLGGELDRKLGIVLQKEWRRILNANRHYRLSERTPTSDSSGRYAISDLSITGERLYRVVALIVDDTPYHETKFEHLPLAHLNNAPYNVWYRQGDYIQALPVAASTVASIWVNHIPPGLTSLVDADTVVFPEGYEEIPVLETAALLLAKGGAETGTAAELKTLAEELRADMLQDISRMSVKPQEVEYTDNHVDWAG